MIITILMPILICSLFLAKADSVAQHSIWDRDKSPSKLDGFGRDQYAFSIHQHSSSSLPKRLKYII